MSVRYVSNNIKIISCIPAGVNRLLTETGPVALSETHLEFDCLFISIISDLGNNNSALNWVSSFIPGIG